MARHRGAARSDALADVRAQLIRPCVHTLKSEFNLNWCVEEDGTPYVSPSQVGPGPGRTRR